MSFQEFRIIRSFYFLWLHSHLPNPAQEMLHLHLSNTLILIDIEISEMAIGCATTGTNAFAIVVVEGGIIFSSSADSPNCW